jgi:zinc D-Ala-D-Ala dipeptidase/carboxypeptidase
MKTVHVPQSAVHGGKLILVNAKNPYCEAYAAPALVPVREPSGMAGSQPVEHYFSEIRMERNATNLLAALMEEISGWSGIVPVSGWRSLEEQREIFSDSMKHNGPDFTRKYVAKPGHSEHQTGLAIDLGKKQTNLDFIRPEFPYWGICQTFRNRASLFGFVERYPKGKEHITGIGHEPWHFRYVGMPHSAIIAQMDFTLEEYLAFLKDTSAAATPLNYPWEDQSVSIYYQKVGEQREAMVEVADNAPYTVSGDNMEGIIVTTWNKEEK